MPLGAFLLAFGAAGLHAAWNTLLARERDPQAAAALTVAFAALTWLPVAILLWRVDADATQWIAASLVLHLVYFVLLAAAYGGGELSLVYPLARGGAPFLLGIVGLLGIGGQIGVPQAIGASVILVGIMLVRGGGEPDPRSVVLALCVAAAIAGYTVVDHEGVQHANPVAYLWCVMAGMGAVQFALMARVRGRPALRQAARPIVALAGVMSFGAYAMVLAAQRLAPAAQVGAVRETSVVMAVLAGALFLGERVTRTRLAGAAVVAVGTALAAT